jgi:DNA-binding Lrp family transcriptional regulator
MSTEIDASTLDRQPRARRHVYELLADDPEGRSMKELLREAGVPEPELRETMRKLEAAGLVRRSRAVWTAVPVNGD